MQVNIIEKGSLEEYKGLYASSVVYDASYDVYNDEGNVVLESNYYHEDIDEILESEFLTNIEENLRNYLSTIKDTIVEDDEVELNLMFVNDKGNITFSIINDIVE
jgi:hypothetical protein